MEEILKNVTANLLTLGPFIFLYFFANLSEKWRILAVSAVDCEFRQKAQNQAKGIRILLLVIILGLYGITIFGALLSLFASEAKGEIELQISADQGIAILIWFSLGSLMFIPWIQKQIAKWIPTNSEDFVHTLSLSLSCLIIFQYHYVLSMGMEALGKTLPSGQNHIAQLISMWTEKILFVLLALVGVGWLTRRNIKECLERLGIVKPDWKTVMLGIGLGAILFVLAYSLEMLSYSTGFLVDPEVDELTKKIYGPLVSSVPGMISIGLAAGLGEEALFRGAMQPRFGIVLTSILFTIVHANYGFSMIAIIVFLLALALGCLRNKYSTTLTMITHASYNIITAVASNLMP